MASTIKRPRLMARAARSGVAFYRRERDLKRFLPRLALTRRRDAIIAAISSAEQTCEADRRAGAASYSLERHIGLLTALFAESRAVKA